MAGNPKRTYPHVQDIKDYPTQRSIKLLWDAVHDHRDTISGLTSDLTAAQATIQQQAGTITTLNKNMTQAIITSGSSLTTNNTKTNTPGNPTNPTDPSGPNLPDNIANHSDIVIAAYSANPPDKTSIASIFNFTRRAAWQLKDITTDDPHPCGLLIKNGGENIFVCGGVSYSISRLCYPNGHIFKILADAGPNGANQPQWVDDGFVDVSLYHPAVDPNFTC
jgi:hypothetical protein